MSRDIVTKVDVFSHPCFEPEIDRLELKYSHVSFLNPIKGTTSSIFVHSITSSRLKRMNEKIIKLKGNMKEYELLD